MRLCVSIIFMKVRSEWDSSSGSGSGCFRFQPYNCIEEALLFVREGWRDGGNKGGSLSDFGNEAH